MVRMRRAVALPRALICLLSAGLLLAGGAPGAATAADFTLERVVLVQRHGVRAPTQRPQLLASWAARSWPTWPVGPGLLTPHGAEVVGLVAGAMRQHFVDQGLLPASGCPGAALVLWADGHDQRTRDSGRMMVDRLAPGCGLAPGFMTMPAGKKSDPIFNSVGGACQIDKAAARRAVAAAIRTPQGPQLVDPASAQAIASLQPILWPGDDAAGRGAAPSTAVVRKSGVRLTGPLQVAAVVSEIFLLEYAEGLPRDQVAWGAADPAQIGGMLAARARQVSLTRALPYQARREGALMTRLFLATLAGQTRAAAPAIGPDVKVLALAGHDDNLSNMAGVFGVNWSLPGQPDATAPATAFTLEVWRDANGTRSVTATIWYAELEGMRTLNPAAVHAVKVAIPGCGAAAPGTCALDALTKSVLATLPDTCGQ